jgi:hypothetical protein
VVVVPVHAKPSVPKNLSESHAVAPGSEAGAESESVVTGIDAIVTVTAIAIVIASGTKSVKESAKKIENASASEAGVVVTTVVANAVVENAAVAIGAMLGASPREGAGPLGNVAGHAGSSNGAAPVVVAMVTVTASTMIDDAAQ